MAENKFLDPAGLALISRMSLVARHAVDGFLSGVHPSPYHGSSIEYADHRPYTLGDEIRTIDWKLLAKTNKTYVKLFEDQTNVRTTVILDASRSMAFKSGDVAMSKFEYGAYVSAALSYLMLRQNDAIGFALIDDQVRQYLPARSQPSYFRRIVETLEQTTPSNATAIGPALHEVASRVKGRGIIVFISDMIDDVDDVINGLSHFRHQHNDVLVFQLIDPAEMDFPFNKLTRFKDMEGAGTILTNPRSVRKEYLKRLQAFLNQCRTDCLERGMSYERLPTGAPYEQSLSAYLEKRKRIKK